MGDIEDHIGRLRDACEPSPHRLVLADRGDIKAVLDALDEAHHSLQELQAAAGALFNRFAVSDRFGVLVTVKTGALMETRGAVGDVVVAVEG